MLIEAKDKTIIYDEGEKKIASHFVCHAQIAKG
jgi:hypothetical protein